MVADAPITAGSPRIDKRKLSITIGALLLAPAVGGTIVMAAIPLVNIHNWREAPSIASVALFGLRLGLGIGGPVALVIGFPLHLLLKKLGWTHPAVYVGLGAALAALVGLAYTAPFGPEGFD
jgi:hypothetical protein